MIDCPRCGFLQPEDRFCANCGLDMLNFKPKPRPWYLRLIRSPLFQAVTSLIIIVGILLYIFQAQTAKIQSRIADAAISKALTSSPQDDDLAADVEGQQVPETKSPRVAEPPPTNAVAPAAETSNVVAEQAPGAAPAKIPESAEVNFYEVPRDQLAAILQDAKSANVAPTIQVFYLPNMDKLATLVQLAHKLPGSFPVHFKESGDQHQYLIPITGTDSAYGLSLSVYAPVAAANEHFSVHFVGTSMGLQKGSTTETVHLQVDDNLITTSDQPAVLVGLIPNNMAIPGTPAELAESPLSILNSPHFQQNLTDAVITVQFK